MKTTIIIPILHFNDYSREAMTCLAAEPTYPNLKFMFVVSTQEVKDELQAILGDAFGNEHRVEVAGSMSSNALRSYAGRVDTDHFYYCDCDDTPHYGKINEFAGSLTEDDTVHCFDVERVLIKDGKRIPLPTYYHEYRKGPVSRLEDLPVTVYSKFIPAKYAALMDFPNLPFTQDWAISNTLYLAAPHVLYPECTYTYYIYPTSSSRAVYDTRARLNRVNVYSRQLIDKFRKRGLKSEAEFLKFRYNTGLAPRYFNIGVLLAPYVPSVRSMLGYSLRVNRSIAYQTLLRVKDLCKSIVRTKHTVQP